MVLALTAVLGIFLLAFVLALYVGARAGPLRNEAEEIDKLRYKEGSEVDVGSAWDAKSPAVANVSPNMHHLMAWAPIPCTSIHRPAGGIPV